MPISRIVTPETDRLDLSGGDWLIVKRRLNTGEQRAYFARLYIAGADGAMRVNPMLAGTSLVLAYLLDWSFIGLDGTILQIRDQPIETVSAILDALDPESFAEVRKAIEEHDKRQQEAREQEKNDRDGGTKSPAISPSRVGSAGATSGLPN